MDVPTRITSLPADVQVQYRMTPVFVFDEDDVNCRTLFLCSGELPNTVVVLLLLRDRTPSAELLSFGCLAEMYEKLPDNPLIHRQVSLVFNEAGYAFTARLEKVYVFVTDKRHSLFAVPDVIELGGFPYQSSLCEAYDNIMGR